MLDNPTPAPKKRTINPALKLALELGPLAVFFATYWIKSKIGAPEEKDSALIFATGVLMACVVVTLAISYALLRRIPVMPLVTAIIVVIFGSLTLYFHNKTFAFIKPTVLYVLFAGALFGGLAVNRPLLPVLFDGALHLRPEGWRKLTWRWAFFFLGLAVLNEIVWRTQTEAFWVGFKTFGATPLTILFALSQASLVMRYEAKGEEAEDAL
jgi:intracellular septation protein